MNKIKKYLVSLCTVLGALVLVIGVVLGWAAWYGSGKVYIEPHSVVMVDMSHNFSEVQNSSIIDELLGNQGMSFYKLLQAIEMAGIDERVDALVAKIDISNLDMAQIQDVARAVMRFKASGKPSYVYSQGFGPLGQGNREYYLATFFDKIYMQPHTEIGLTGINIEIPFFKGIMDKLGVEAEFYTRYEYKSAMMSFTDKKMSAPAYEEMYALAENLMEEIKSDIKFNRQLEDNIDNLINRAPLSAEEGIKLGLIDELMYLPQLEEKLKNDGAEAFVSIEDYASTLRLNSGNLPTIAYLSLNGVINNGETSTDFDGEYVVGSQSVLANLAEIEELENLKAIVVRINSPGGSYTAADEIYFALKQIKEKKNIPIIISQSGYAASGGYYISLAGDHIIAEPTTITGSIGVLGGKFVLEKMWQKLDVMWEGIKIGDNAGILSINKTFSKKEKQNFNASLDAVYEDFTSKVLENRHLSKEIDEVARGRVWSGRQALELGLIDELGGLDEAMAVAKQKGFANPEEKFKLAIFPKEKSFSEKLQDLVIGRNVSASKILSESGVDIRYLKLFKRLQYDTVLPLFDINM